MTFTDWKASVDTILKQNKVHYRTDVIDEHQMHGAFESGESPVVFAKRSDHQAARPKVAEPSVPVPQSAIVLNDPKYNLDTGLGLHCPICGSTFIKPVPKEGTGLGYIGSFGWIMAVTAVESALQYMQNQPYVCGYCEAGFTADVAAKSFAEPKH